MAAFVTALMESAKVLYDRSPILVVFYCVITVSGLVFWARSFHPAVSPNSVVDVGHHDVSGQQHPASERLQRRTACCLNASSATPCLRGGPYRRERRF